MNEYPLKLPSDPATTPVNPMLQAHARLREAERHREAKAFDKAKPICTGLLKEYPDYVGALLTLGLVQAEIGEYEAARVSLSRAAMLDPREWRILTALARVYLKLNAIEMATRTWEQAHALNPEDSSIPANLAKMYHGQCEYELAAANYARALALDPLQKPARLGLAMSLKHLGRFEETAEVLKAVLHESPEDISALQALSQMPAKYVDIDVLKTLDRMRAEQDKSRDVIDLAFARAQALDKAGRYEEAWQEAVWANSRIFPTVAEQSARDERTGAMLLDMLKRWRPGAQMQQRGDVTCRSLFILGPSRAGKSTMEQLIGCLPGVRKGYENPIVTNAARRTFQNAGLITGKWLVDLPPELNALFCKNYAVELDERAKGAQLFTNTSSGFIADAARFALAVPGVFYLFIKRDVHDLALRIYLKLYQQENFFSYDLMSIYRYIAWYHAMMDEIAGKFPDIVHVIAYEDIVADPRHALGQVADFCGMAVHDLDLPNIGDDRGAAIPYRAAMDALLNVR